MIIFHILVLLVVAVWCLVCYWIGLKVGINATLDKLQTVAKANLSRTELMVFSELFVKLVKIIKRKKLDGELPINNSKGGWNYPPQSKRPKPPKAMGGEKNA